MAAHSAGHFQPPIFLSHGGGPCFFMEPDGRIDDLAKGSEASLSFKRVADDLCARYGPPSALVVISAHWEADFDGVQVIASERPSLLYDYYGFPDYTYQIDYVASGHPALAREVQHLIQSAGIECRASSDRGWDHGVFIPLKLMFPDADVPIVQLSLHRSLSPAIHLRIGEALQELRERNVMVIGSGFSTHNMSSMGQHTAPWARDFSDWLTDTLAPHTHASEQKQRLMTWERSAKNGCARKAHPREEHFLPLLVCAGASAYTPARKALHLVG